MCRLSRFISILVFIPISRKLWKFSTTRQMLKAIHKASLFPDEYNISINANEDCDGGTLEGIKINQKLRNVLKISSSVLLPRGENHEVDALEKYINNVLGLPITNAYHTQLVKYQTQSEVKIQARNNKYLLATNPF